MFYKFTNVQRGKAVPLQQYIDNRDGRLCIGLRSITFTVGWYNVEPGESIEWESNSDENGNMGVYAPPGLYSFTQLKEFLEGARHSGPPVILRVSRVDGVITLTTASDLRVRLADGFLSMLGLDDGLGGGEWLDPGNTYSGDRPINFASNKVLSVHLEQINITGNTDDGAPSTILTDIGVKCPSYGEFHTVRIENPEYKPLQNGTINELTITLRDESGKVIDNHDLPVSVTLEVR